ncbi:hypothetical protein [Nostoc sp. JL23]|uniref:hypothetical protein n=1 Tax=Nostoc sp. JL23 TaxID=2815394 RepID=UPI001DE4A5E2|nr:hypothetical protein [Nostoc sp. JL23]MBN3875268.1 hypothetical protein [Nostoc sp. JL23]
MEQPGIYKIEKLIPESQLRDAIKEILAEMLGVNATAQPNRQWYDTDPAYCHLGLDSAEQLREMVRNGLLRIGIEVRDVRSPSSQIPRYQFHIEKCEARLLQSPEKRRGKKIA